MVATETEAHTVSKRAVHILLECFLRQSLKFTDKECIAARLLISINTFAYEKKQLKFSLRSVRSVCHRTVKDIKTDRLRILL